MSPANRGRPIGKFQAIQHMLADLAGETTPALMAAAIRAGGRAFWPYLTTMTGRQG